MAITRETVTVESFYTQNATQLHLKLIAGAGGLKRIIRESTVNRPGLALTGFTKYFAMKRVQVFGNAEYYYCRSMERAERAKRYRSLEAEVSRLAAQSEGDIRDGFLSIASSWAQLAQELEASLAVQAAEAAERVPEVKDAALRPPPPEPEG